MANKNHVVQIKRGVKVWNAWRRENRAIVPDLNSADLRRVDLISDTDLFLRRIGADLRDADLSGADLRDANLSDANLSGATLISTNFSGATLSNAFFYKAFLYDADLSGADLRNANLSGADLRIVNLRGADLARTTLDRIKLCDADLREASLIDSRLDGADLTGVKLWETQRGGWSIKGIICQRAFWDRDGKEPTEYEAGAFERIFAEKLPIKLHYEGGMSPVDLAMLPLIIERLQTKHPNCKLHIRSVQDDGSGATVTITVEDLAGRSDKVFAQDIEVLRDNLVTIQKRLRKEKRLRLQAEASYRTMVRNVMPELLDRVQPKTETHIGQITGPTIIEGTTMSGDTNINQGQAGIVGRDGHAHDMTFQQLWNQGGIDLPTLAKELGQLRAAMKEAEGKDEQDEAIGAVAAAEKAASKGDGPTTLQHLKAAGQWTLGVAEKIGVAVAAEAIKRAM